MCISFQTFFIKKNSQRIFPCGYIIPDCFLYEVFTSPKIWLNVFPITFRSKGFTICPFISSIR